MILKDQANKDHISPKELSTLLRFLKNGKVPSVKMLQKIDGFRQRHEDFERNQSKNPRSGVLPDVEIIRMIYCAQMVIYPFHEVLLSANTYKVTLFPQVKIRKSSDVINPFQKQEYNVIDISEHGYILMPRTTLLGATNEYLSLGFWIMAQIEGLSTGARFSIKVHNDAPTIQAGSSFEHSHQVTLELSTTEKAGVILKPYMEIGQLFFNLTYVKSSCDYNATTSTYNGQEGPTEPRPMLTYAHLYH